MNERPYTVARLAERWECSNNFIYAEITRGHLKANRYGSKLIRIPVEFVEEYEAEAIVQVSPEVAGKLIAPAQSASGKTPAQIAREVRRGANFRAR